jgi:hypothetical protein
MPIILATQEAEIRRIVVETGPRSSSKNKYPIQIRADRVSHLVECLNNKNEVLSSNPSMAKNISLVSVSGYVT